MLLPERLLRYSERCVSVSRFTGGASRTNLDKWTKLSVPTRLLFIITVITAAERCHLRQHAQRQGELSNSQAQQPPPAAAFCPEHPPQEVSSSGQLPQS